MKIVLDNRYLSRLLSFLLRPAAPPHINPSRRSPHPIQIKPQKLSISRTKKEEDLSIISPIKMEIRTVHRDEEGKKQAEKVPLPKTRHPETVRHIERKLVDKGLHRLERHPVDGLGGIGVPPPKSGRGGKFTWEGPDGVIENELDPAPPALDPKDPNYVPEDPKVPEEEEELVVGEVEVVKAAEAKEGVARIDVVPPVQD